MTRQLLLSLGSPPLCVARPPHQVGGPLARQPAHPPNEGRSRTLWARDLRHGPLYCWRCGQAEAVDITESSYIAVIIAKCGGLGSSKCVSDGQSPPEGGRLSSPAARLNRSTDDGDDEDEEDGKKGGGDGGEAPAPAHAPSSNACPKCGYDGSGGGGTVGQQMMGNAAIATAAVGGSSRVASNGISAAVATVP